MMKFHSILTAGLAALVVVPAALQDDQLQALKNALSKTDQALGILRDVGTQFDTDAEGAGRMLLAATEPPVLDERWRDERMIALRDEVGRLQGRLDTLRSPDVLPPLVTHTPEGPRISVPLDMPGTSPLALTREEAMRRANDPTGGRRTPRPGGRGELAPGTPNPGRPTTPLPLPEGQEYSADPIGHARACYRTGRFEQGLALLRGRKEPVAMYWRARCLEKLERIPEAVQALEQVIADAPDTSEARRARTDLEFLRWKSSFVENLPAGMKNKGGDSQ